MTNVPILGRDVARSSTWSVGGQLAGLIVSLMATPFTVRLLGPEGYGLLALMTAVIAYVSVLDLGMGAASTRFGAEAFSKEDGQGESAAVWTATLLTLVPTTACALVMWLASPVLVSHVLHVGISLRDEAAWALRLASVALVARVLGNVVNTPLLVRLRWDLYTLITAGTAMGQGIAVPVVVFFGGGVVAATSVLAAAAVGALVLLIVAAARLQPALRSPAFKRSLARPLLGFGAALLVGNVVGIALGNAERFFLAGEVSISQVGQYSVAANLSALLGVFPIAVSQPLLPTFSRLHASQNWSALASLYRRSLVVILVLVLPAAVVLGVVGRRFLNTWAGPGYGSAGIGPLRILLFGMVANAITFVPYNFLLAVGSSKAVTRCHLLRMPLYPFYAYLLIRIGGIDGAAIVWTVTSVIGATLVFLAAGRQDPTLPRFRSVVGGVIAPMSVLLVPIGVQTAWPDGGLAYGTTAVFAGAYLWLAWHRVLEGPDRDALLKLLRRRTSTETPTPAE